MSWRWIDKRPLLTSYGLGLAKNRAFVDGNKRAAFLAVGLFLALTGMRLKAEQAEAVLTRLGVDSGALSEHQFAGWTRQHAKPR